MELNAYQDSIIFKEPTGIRNREQLAQSLIGLTVGLVSEVGELANAVQKGGVFGEKLNKVDIIDEISDLFWYSTAMLKEMGIKAEDVLEANHLKLRQRMQHGEYQKNYKAEKLFFKDLVNE